MTLTVSKVDTQLRGYITLFLFEIGTGIYVGKVNRRVRENLWQKVEESIAVKGGEACLVYQNNQVEQGFSILLKNYPREIIDVDGISFLNKPTKKTLVPENKKSGWSKAYWRRKRK